MASKYTAESIQVIKDDRDRVRQSPNMYIPNRAKEGAIHCGFEIIDNSIDELQIPNSAGKHLQVSYDKKTKALTVVDDGRGIPLEKLYDVLTVLAASGKFNNGQDSAYATSGGRYGHGSTVVLALSKSFKCRSTRDGKYLEYEFVDGLKVREDSGKAKGHGTTTTFILDPKIIDTKEVTDKDYLERLKEKSYVFPNIEIEFTELNDGKVGKTHKFSGKTILDRLKKWNLTTDPVYIQEDRDVTFLQDITDDKLTTAKVSVNVAFAFSEDILDGNADDYTISYANTIKTYDGGVHTQGVQLGIQKYFRDKVIPNLKGKDKELPIMPSDMIAGLGMFVVVNLPNPEFRGQEKTQLSNQEVKFAVRDAVYDALCKNKSNSAMIEFVKRVTRGRMASKKTRKKDVSNAFSKDRLDKFKDVIYTLDTVATELLIVEGDSAADNAATARDEHNQAIYGISRPANIFDMSSDVVSRIKSTFNDVLDICGIEPGKKCDPEKSTMRYILMLTDADVDGDDIAISTVCLLAKHCRPLIDAGMVGRILPPAYSIPVGKGKRIFVRSQREFFGKIIDTFIKKETIAHHGKEMTKKELRQFIQLNFEYDTRLKKLADRQCCDPLFMEYICWNYHGSYKDQKKSYWMNKLKKYPGLKILNEDGTLVIDGDAPGIDYVNLAFDEHTDKLIHRFKEFQKVNKDIYGFSINDKPDKTLYEVMHQVRTYIPAGVERYKGLGELSPDEMRELCMDKDKRTVVIFKFKDFEKDMDKINVIMSTKSQFVEARKAILQSLRADTIDIDT